MTHPAITRALATAQATFAAQGATWDERTEAAVRSLLTLVSLAMDDLVMPEDVVRAIRHCVGRACANEDVPEDVAGGVLSIIDVRYDDFGRHRKA